MRYYKRSTSILYRIYLPGFTFEHFFLVKPRKMVNDHFFWVNGQFMPYERFIWSGQRFDSFLPRTLLEQKKLAIYGHIWPYMGPQAILKP